MAAWPRSSLAVRAPVAAAASVKHLKEEEGEGEEDDGQEEEDENLCSRSWGSAQMCRCRCVGY